jgi:hypothetical protein
MKIHKNKYVSMLQACVVSLTIIFIVANCRSTKDGQSNDQVKNNSSINNQGIENPLNNPTIIPGSSNQLLQDTNKIKLTRQFLDKKIEFLITSSIEDGMTKIVWKEKIYENEAKENRVTQISSKVLLYSEFPSTLKGEFFGISQPMKLEFLDSSFQSLRFVDIWTNRPFQNGQGKKLTYYHFDAESMNVLPFSKQEKSEPTEYSITTQVKTIGNYVIVIYKNYTLQEHTILDAKPLLKIYDISGQLISSVENLSTCDQVAVSPSGKYMMYSFGGLIPTVNQPFASLDDRGWAIMDLKTKKIIYSELEKEGTILNGVYFVQGFLESNSTTPFDKVHYDYKVFFDEIDRVIYRKLWLQSEWDKAIQESNSTGNSDWRYFIKKYQFEKIAI